MSIGAVLLGLSMMATGQGFGIAMGLLLLGAGAVFVFRLIGNRAAAEIVGDSVTIQSSFGSKSMPLHQITQIKIETITINFIFRQYFLVIKGNTADGEAGFLQRAVSGKTLKLPMAGIEGGKNAVMQFAARLEILRENPVAARLSGSAMATSPDRRIVAKNAPQPVFDADAAIARYLATRENALVAPPAAQAYPAASQRPGFGRKVA
jgi:hypothetical protein